MYTPLSLEEVSPLHEVGPGFSLAEAERLEELVGREPRNPRMIEGIIAERSNETLSVDMSVASELQGARVQTFRQRVASRSSRFWRGSGRSSITAGPSC